MEPMVLLRRIIHRVSSIIVFLAILGTVKESHGQITFIEEPKSTTVVAGNPVSFNCTATSSLTVKYSWQFMGKKIISSSDGRVTIRSDGTLAFTDVKPRDDGDYVCVAITKKDGDRNREKSQKAVLTVHSICSVATLKTIPDNSQHGVDRKIEMTCDCSSKPSASIAWFRDGTELTNGGRISITGNKLVIDKLQLGDTGSYVCDGSNIVGRMRSSPKDIQVINAVVPTFDSKPKPKVYAKLGENFKLACRASGTPTPTIEWYYGTQSSPLITSSEHTVTSDGSLTILKVEDLDFAKYKCVAKNFLSSISAEVTLIEAKIENFSFSPPKMYAEIGEVFQATCYPKAVPKAKITWQTAKGGSLPASYIVNDDTITIKNIKESDSANVTCIAANIAGTKAANLEIKTAVFPSITTQPRHTTTNENSKAKLECTVTSSLAVNVIWSKNGKTLVPDSLHKINSNNALVFKKVSKSDEGVYQCFVRTKEDVTPLIDSRTANMTVNAAVRLLKYNYNHNKFDMGSNATVYCEFTGFGNIKLKWHRKDGKPMSKNAAAIGDHLTISNIQMQDEGIYTCTGSNSFSNARAHVNISVYVFPKFVLKPTNVTIVEYGSAWLHCNATGYPKPKISWGKEELGGEQLDPERFHEFENGTLHTFNIKMSDQGRYYCYIGNIASFKQVTISLKVVPAPVVEAQNKESAMGRTIAIAVGCAAAYIVLVVGLMIYCKRRRAKQQKKEQLTVAADGDIDNCEADPEMALQPINGKPAKYNKMEFPRHDLEALRTLGNGSYGRAFLARASGIKDGERETMVVVKSLMSKDDIQKEDFWRELNALVNMDNPHVVALLGVCRDMDPVYMVFESFDKGDLKQYLLSCYENGRSTLTSGQKLSLCSNIVSGMTYLASNNFAHKDIAARNCMVSKDSQVKIGFLSLSYDLYSSEYYRFNNILIPLRWMAPEAIFSDEFSEKSDVWSYGVLVWEVYTLGQTPFEDRSDEEVLKCIKEDLRLTKPENCPDTMAAVMKKCWEANPDARPTFDKLYAEISEIAVDTHL